MLDKVRVSQVQTFYYSLVKQVLVSKLALKQELQSFAMDHLTEALGSQANNEQNKAVAIFNLLFINKDGIANKEKGSQLQILAENAN